MKLTLRFAVLVIALVAAVAASADAGLGALTRLDAALTRIVEDDVERLLAITHTRRLFRSMVVQERDFILAKDEAERAPLVKKLKSLPKELDEQLETYARLMPAEDAAVVAAIRGARERWTELDERVQAAAKRDQDTAFKLAKQHSDDPVSWEKAIGGLVKLSEQRLADQVKQTHQVYLSAQSKLLWVSGTAAFLAAVFGGAIFLGIRRNLHEVVRLNTNLEGLVKARTQALAERERSLRLVLDSTGDGLFEVARSGQLTGDASVAAVNWFGAPQAGGQLAQYLYPEDPDQAASFAVAFEQLAEDVLPWDLCRDQMPRRLQRKGAILELEWKRVLENDAFAKVLVVARDITNAVQSERAERNAREQQSLIAKLLQDKTGFAQFVKECEQLIAALGATEDETSVKRYLHTLKGNTAIFGLSSLAEACHAIEDRIAVAGGSPSAEELADLAALWRARMQSIEAFLSELGSSKLEVEITDHARLIESLLARQDYEEIIGMVELWSWPRTAERLSRLRAHLTHLARRLNKHVQVVTEHNDLRVPETYLEKFWPTMIHVLRNAVDHGAEAESARIAFGKSPATNIVLSTRLADGELLIEVRDDGAGVDRGALLLSARNKGYTVSESTPLADLMFMDGVSSRSEISETSGRGVGLAAVKQACEAEAGSIEVHSESQRGTSITFRFPRPIVKPGALAARLERRWSLLPRNPANRNCSARSPNPPESAVFSPAARLVAEVVFVHFDGVSRDWLAVIALTALALTVLQRAWQRWRAKWRLQRRMQRARLAEVSAGEWLRERGYTVTAAQVAGSYALCVDGEDVTVQVRADYVVERDGARYVAEVKSGQTAPSLQTQATRRQLLEYRMAFDVDGVLLVDAETERVHEVSFPITWPRAVPRTRWHWLVIGFFLAGLAALFARTH